MGKLEAKYKKDAFYVHLIRNRTKTAESFLKRAPHGIIRAFHRQIISSNNSFEIDLNTALDYYDTVNTNIKLFLKDKPRKMEFRVESAVENLKKFWTEIGAEGNQEKAIREWSIKYNKSESPEQMKKRKREAPGRLRRFLSALKPSGKKT
ncbi:MAG: hypothetical protein ACLFQK_02380 [Fibrobacterota bacterium]